MCDPSKIFASLTLTGATCVTQPCCHRLDRRRPGRQGRRLFRRAERRRPTRRKPTTTGRRSNPPTAAPPLPRTKHDRQQADVARAQGLQDVSADSQKTAQAAEQDRLTSYLQGDPNSRRVQHDRRRADRDQRRNACRASRAATRPSRAISPSKLDQASADAKKRIAALAGVGSYGGSVRRARQHRVQGVPDDRARGSTWPTITARATWRSTAPSRRSTRCSTPTPNRRFPASPTWRCKAGRRVWARCWPAR